MAYLQMSTIPNSQSLRPGESLLSTLLTAGEAGLTFQQLIFAGLHIDDAINLRLTSRRMNDIVKGHDRSIQHGTPGGFPILGIHNSTLLWLGRKCNGTRFPGAAPCHLTPLTEGEGWKLFDCDGTPPPLDPASVNGDCCGETCTDCKDNVTPYVVARMVVLRTHPATSAALCMHCTRQAVRRYPYGYGGCICMGLRRGHRCWVCDYDIYAQLRKRAVDALEILTHVHRNRQGRIFHRPDKPRLRMVPCPGCGRVHYNRNQNFVATYCLSCNGLNVAATIGTHRIANSVVPGRPTRRSERIRNRMAREPTIGLDVVQHPLQK